MSIPETGLRPLWPTGWTVRTVAIEVVLKNYAAIVETMEEISRLSHDDYGRRAGGILAILERLSTFFGLKFAHLVFSATEQTSLALQGKGTTVQEAISAASITKSFVCKHKNNLSFEQFYSTTVVYFKKYAIEPVLPRYKRITYRYMLVLSLIGSLIEKNMIDSVL